MSALVEMQDVRVRLPVRGELRPVLRGVDLEIDAGEAVGLVGESGSGKSMTARTLTRTLPAGAEVSGKVLFDGDPVLDLRGGRLRRYRSHGIAMIFQDPRAHTNPVRTIGQFLTEGMRTNGGMRSRAANARAVELLGDVGLADAEGLMRQYPHQLSGGMLQRVMIASALASEPRLILADEPTTALDVTTQSEVMGILDELRTEHGLAMLFITHDLDLAAAVCDRIAVMYAGTLVEEQDSSRLHDAPQHPYTAALSASRPRIDAVSERLFTIAGRPQSAFDAPGGCPFAPRCPYVQPRCTANLPPMEETAGGRVACLRHRELAPQLAEVARAEAP